MRTYFRMLAPLWALLCCLGLAAAEVIPAAPARHFNDYANVTSAGVQQRLDRVLEDLEKSDSTQVIVVIYPKMQSDSDIAEYTVRVAEKWGVGTKEKDNGAVLFVFVQDRKMYLQVGYGLEGAIPDITAKDITENRIKPYFRSNNYDAGLTAGVEAIIQAARGEYKGTGRTAANQSQGRSNGSGVPFFILVLIIFAIIGSTRRRRGHFYTGHGRRSWGGPVIWTGGGGGGWGGGSRGGGGGFSGGGGSFGGGGAGSSW